MKLKNLHIEEETDALAKSEKKRRGIKEAEVLREIIALGTDRYKRKYKI